MVGLAGGVVLTAAAGAQRTGTAFTRLLQASRAADVAVVPNASGQGYFTALARLPGVAGETRVLSGEVGNMWLVLPGGARVAPIGADVSVDGGFGTLVDRFKVLAGRMYRPGSADEVVIDREVNRHAAFGLGIHRCLGSHLARMELRIALEVWLERIPEFSLADPGAVRWAAGQIRGPRTLPLRIG